jgi:hypothetical protein
VGKSIETYLSDINKKRERNDRGRFSERKHVSDGLCNRIFYIARQRGQPYVKHAKRLFRRNLPKGLPFSFDWMGATGVIFNYSNNEAFINLSYDIQWRGMRFMRSFAPKTDADIVAEAWRVSGLLLAWDDNKDVKNV